MTKIFRLFYLLALVFTTSSAFSQKYKTIADTAKLNKEYVDVHNDLVSLYAKLTIAQNDLPGYQSKAKDADNDAEKAANASTDQASKATNGTVGDARTAKRRSKKAFREAKDSREAKNRLSDHEDKITRYKLDIKKKEQRLEELDVMRIGINTKVTADSLRQVQIQQ